MESDYRTGMQKRINKPIFIVGSPRSGTSVLTWCLGQHQNIIAIDESTGIGDLAIALAICYQTKTGLSAESLWTGMNVESGQFFAAFGHTINKLILRHKVDPERRRWEEAVDPDLSLHSLVTEESANIPKARWVDGTPEYSFNICGLRKLFPDAQFIHIVRNVTSVVRSMLNFHRLAGVKLVANEREAYDYWFRAVSSCLLAEQAYGPSVVFRLLYSDLIDQPEASLRSVLSFLGEPFAAGCLTPLEKRINSSNVPAGFKLGSSDMDPAVVERANRLYAEIKAVPQAPAASATAINEIAAAFGRRVQYMATLEQRLNTEREELREGYKTEVRRLNTEREEMREGYETEVRRLNTEREETREGYETEVRRLNTECEELREGYETEVRRLNAECEELREGYETEVRRLNTVREEMRNRANRLAKEVQNKRAIIHDLRARSLRHKLRGLLFGHNLNAQRSSTELRAGDAAEETK